MMNVLALCVHRNISIPTFIAVSDLIQDARWDCMLETGDALISRARSIVATKWLQRYTPSDVLVMSDDDFSFTDVGINAVAALAREKRGIVAGVTPTRGGRYTAIVPLDGSLEEPWLDPDTAPLEIRYAGGLIAYHRDVFETLAKDMPLLHENDVIPAFYPFFMPAIVALNGRKDYLSEDYACHERARRAGFHVWVEPKCQVGHLASIMVSHKNIENVRRLLDARTE